MLHVCDGIRTLNNYIEEYSQTAHYAKIYGHNLPIFHNFNDLIMQ